MSAKTTLIAIACFALVFPAFGQTKFLPGPAEARKVAESMVASVAAGNFAGALAQLRPLSVLPSAELDVLEAQYNTQAAQLLQRFGPPLGYEFIREEKSGASLLRYTFIVRYEKAPLRWIFIFYRAEKGWVNTDFKFDGNLGALFEAGG